MAKQGSLSINSENIFPIIKKWLYSDHDIFIRELVSNGCDAVTKLKKLSVMGEFEEADDEKYKVEVRINPTDKTLTFIDNGIGMTEDEVDEYINQIAFSGAAAFMEQYKDKASDEQIIGHFGLGFYSAFMVADKVTIDTLSYKEGATPVHWECDGGTEFDMEDGDKAERGTTITLYLNDESYEFCNEYRCREVLNKYCSFMPVEIYFVNEEEEAKKAEEAAKKDAEEKVIDVDVKDADAKENNRRRNKGRREKKSRSGNILRRKNTFREKKRKKMMHLSQSTRFIHYGQSIQTTVLMKNIKNFTVMYSTIIKSLYSGFI